MRQSKMLVLGALLAGAASLASADVAVGVSVRSREKPRYSGYYYNSTPRHSHGHHHYTPYRTHHDRHHQPRYARGYRPVYAAPVIYSAPVYIQQPTPLSDTNYAADIGTLRERMARLRSITENQYKVSQIDQSEYDRFMQTLDGIDRTQRERAFNRGGNLATYDFDDLNHRLDQLDEDIEIALAR